jgi:hypothetical protein
MKINYELKEIYPKVFLVTTENSYDLAMTFCRVQEFYESPHKEIRGKNFDMVEFQRLYTMRRGEDCFTYPADWTGFNVPSKIIWYCYFANNIPNPNQYDETFETIVRKITENTNSIRDAKYYLIGAQAGNQTTIDHEVAHAFYYLYPAYKKEANKIIKQLPKRLEKKITDWLLEIGYNKKVIKDEIQAYLTAENLSDNDVSTSPTEDKKLEKIAKELKKLNEKYKKMN